MTALHIHIKCKGINSYDMQLQFPTDILINCLKLALYYKGLPVPGNAEMTGGSFLMRDTVWLPQTFILESVQQVVNIIFGAVSKSRCVLASAPMYIEYSKHVSEQFNHWYIIHHNHV